jgi:hypothetical protein
MTIWLTGALIYTGTGIVFAWLKWGEDRERAQRSRDLRRALDIRVPEHPIWMEVLGLSLIRATVWPLHLVIHDL